MATLTDGVRIGMVTFVTLCSTFNAHAQGIIRPGALPGTINTTGTRIVRGAPTVTSVTDITVTDGLVNKPFPEDNIVRGIIPTATASATTPPPIEIVSTLPTVSATSTLTILPVDGVAVGSTTATFVGLPTVPTVTTTSDIVTIFGVPTVTPSAAPIPVSAPAPRPVPTTVSTPTPPPAATTIQVAHNPCSELRDEFPCFTYGRPWGCHNSSGGTTWQVSPNTGWHPWSRRRLTATFMNGTAVLQNRVKTVVADLELHGYFHVVWTDRLCDTDIRIKFGQYDAGSAIGTQACHISPWQPTMELATQVTLETFLKMVRHCWLHALGFPDTHQAEALTFNRPVLRYLLSLDRNCYGPVSRKFQILSQFSQATFNLDMGLDSVMRCGLDNQGLLTPDSPVQQPQLSQHDISTLQTLYPFPTNWMYEVYLHRSASASELSVFTSQQNFHWDFLTVGSTLLYCDEYSTHITNQMYTFALHRLPTAEELAAAVDCLKNGGTIFSLLIKLLCLDEFYQLAGGTDAGYQQYCRVLILGARAGTAGSGCHTYTGDRYAFTHGLVYDACYLRSWVRNEGLRIQGHPLTAAQTDRYVSSLLALDDPRNVLLDMGMNATLWRVGSPSGAVTVTTGTPSAAPSAGITNTGVPNSTNEWATTTPGGTTSITLGTAAMQR